MADDLILQTTNLGKRYGRRWAVDALHLEVHRGDVFGFLGPNGAGKSTTIRMVLSLITPTAGDVRLFGHSLKRRRADALRNVGGIVEKPDFYLYLSAVRNLEIAGALSGGVSRARINELLDLVGLGDRRDDKVKAYSHGMKQRLGIAQALLSDPEFVILDEPTNGLDPAGMKEIRELIIHLSRDRKKTVFISSHLLAEIEMIANRMAVINRGRLAVQGNVQELLNSGEQRVVLHARPRETVLRILGEASGLVSGMQEAGDSFILTMAFETIPALNRLLVERGAEVYSLIPRRSLEDYFLSITEASAEAPQS